MENAVFYIGSLLFASLFGGAAVGFIQIRAFDQSLTPEARRWASALASFCLCLSAVLYALPDLRDGIRYLLQHLS